MFTQKLQSMNLPSLCRQGGGVNNLFIYLKIKQNTVVTIFAFTTFKSSKSSLLLEFESQYKGIWIKRSNGEIRFYSFPGIRVSLKMNS